MEDAKIEVSYSCEYTILQQNIRHFSDGIRTTRDWVAFDDIAASLKELGIDEVPTQISVTGTIFEEHFGWTVHLLDVKIAVTCHDKRIPLEAPAEKLCSQLNGRKYLRSLWEEKILAYEQFVNKDIMKK